MEIYVIELNNVAIAGKVHWQDYNYFAIKYHRVSSDVQRNIFYKTHAYYIYSYNLLGWSTNVWVDNLNYKIKNICITFLFS